MYARNVTFRIKANMQSDYTHIFENQILPLLQKQKGFKEELTLVSSSKGLGISIWEDRASADAYATGAYPQVLEKLNPTLVGKPNVETFDVTASALAN